MDAGTICAFDFHINGGRGGSCADFIKGGLDSHNGRCERGNKSGRYCFLSFGDQKASKQPRDYKEGKFYFSAAF